MSTNMVTGVSTNMVTNMVMGISEEQDQVAPLFAGVRT